MSDHDDSTTDEVTTQLPPAVTPDGTLSGSAEAAADNPPQHATDTTADTIPLYAAAPVSAPESPTSGTPPKDSDAVGSGDESRDGASAGFAAGTAGPGSRPRQPYVYVPPQSPQPEILLHKSGPSTPTLVFGSFLLFIGVVALLLSLHFPNMVFAQLYADPRVFVAVMCAVAGLILVAVAVAWSLAKLVHGIGERHRGQAGSAQPQRATDTAATGTAATQTETGPRTSAGEHVEHAQSQSDQGD